jgi:lipoprotein-releasing system permease protein
MSLKIAPFLAWRYVREATRQSTIQTMIWICLSSIFVGTFSLALIVSIMTGFESATHAKLQGIYPDIIIESPTGTFLDATALKTYLQSTYPEKISHMCSYSSQQLLVHHPTTQEPTVVGILKGIDPDEEMQVTQLHTKFSLPAKQVISSLQGANVFIGKGLAETLEREEGDKITLLYNADPHAKPTDIRFSSLQATVKGLISTGIADYDNTLVIAHQSFVKEMLEDDSTNEMGIKLTCRTDATALSKELNALPGLSAYRWQDLYPSLVSALKLEKYVMCFLLGLITLVASMNNISLLFMFITSKRREIALFKTFGMTTSSIMSIFLLFNFIISSIAASVGLVAAYGVGKLLQWYPFIELPDVYYVTHLPIVLDPFLFAGVFCSVLLLSLLTALLPLSSLSKINITHTLRFE